MVTFLRTLCITVVAWPVGEIKKPMLCLHLAVRPQVELFNISGPYFPI